MFLLFTVGSVLSVKQPAFGRTVSVFVGSMVGDTSSSCAARTAGAGSNVQNVWSYSPDKCIY